MLPVVLPKAARAKYGLDDVEIGLTPSHTIRRQYHIQVNVLVVGEDLIESRFSNRILRQILEIIVRACAKQLTIAENDFVLLDARDRKQQKGNDRGISDNLIQQIHIGWRREPLTLSSLQAVYRTVLVIARILALRVDRARCVHELDSSISKTTATQTQTNHID
ncbi:hypothetical protein PINS_up009806 [Pythium insidiosum]|nr:hypothetical protein PINS_up009806 [Pythium insidiosum]